MSKHRMNKRAAAILQMAAACVLALLMVVQLAAPVYAAAAPATAQAQATAEPGGPEEPPKGGDPAAPEQPGSEEPPPETEPPADEEPAEPAEEPTDPLEDQQGDVGILADTPWTVEIGTFDGLMAFATDWNAGVKYAGKLVTVTLTADIVGLSNGNYGYPNNWGDNRWTPIGTEQNPFTGIFDGGGHTIKGLKIGSNYNSAYPDSATASGFFGFVKGDYDGSAASRGIVRNLYFYHYQGPGNIANSKGGLVGHLDQGHIVNVGFLDDEIYDYNSTENMLEGGFHVGMLAGTAKNSLIERSFAYGEVKYGGSSNTSFRAVGGLVGYAESTLDTVPMLIQDCYFVGQVTGGMGSTATGGAIGGIAGKLDADAGDPDSGVLRCYASKKNIDISRKFAYQYMSITYTGSTGSVGGIAGEVNGGRVANNVSMAQGVLLYDPNKAGVDLPTDVHRIAGKNTGGTVENNLAFDGFMVRTYEKTGSAYPEVTLADNAALNGTDASGRQLRSGGIDGIAEVWAATLGTGGAWYYSAGKAPILKGMGTGALQTGELPLYLVSPADVALFAAEEVSIGTASDLAELAAYVNSGARDSEALTNERSMEGRTVTLTEDIDLSVYPDWTPIGSMRGNGHAFEGLLNGGGKTISNLRSGVANSGEGHQPNPFMRLRGLFGDLDTGWNDGVNGTDHTANAGVYNLILKDPQVCVPAGNEVIYGPDAQYAYESVRAGAIAGYIHDWNDYQAGIRNCAVISTLGQDGNTTGARVWAEGFANAIGGLAGLANGRGNSLGVEENFIITNSYFVGEVDGGLHAQSVGGITGTLDRGAIIDNCFVAPDGAGREIKGPALAGGITGQTTGFNQEYVGIKNCYVASNVRGGTKVGGLIGGMGNVGQIVRSNLVLGSVYGTGTNPKTSHAAGLIGGYTTSKGTFSGTGLSGNFVMSREISSAAGAGTAGRSSGPDISSSDYAFVGTLVNGYTATNHSSIQGYGQTDTWIKKASNWSSRFSYSKSSFSGSNVADDHWVLADGKLPVLKNMPEGYAQSDALPAHIKAVPQATGFSIDKSHYDFTLEKDQDRATFYVWYKPEPATSLMPDLDVTSSNSAIRFHGDYFGFSGFKEGESNTATITVTAKFSGGNQIETFTVAIDEQIPDVVSISMQSTLNLQENRTYQLTPSKQPYRARLTDAVWTSSDPAVATVDQTGVVTGVSAGTATVTITMPADKNGGTEVSKSTTVTVVEYAAITSFKFSGVPASINQYGYSDFYLDIAPEAVLLNHKDVTFTVEPEDIASAYGNYNSSTKRWNVTVQANKEVGSATITASCNDNGTLWSDSCTIQIGSPVPLAGIAVPDSLTVAKGASQTVMVTAKPDGAALPGEVYLEIVAGSAKDLDGKATSATVASVSGKTVTGVNPGTVQVVAKAFTGEGDTLTSGKCTVTVPAILEQVALTPATLSLKVGGASRQLEVSAATPHAQLPDDAAFAWAVLNEKDGEDAATSGVVSVDADGQVTALKLGSATVEVTVTGAGIAAEGLKAQAQVTVREGLTGVWFANSADAPVTSLLLDAAGEHDLSSLLRSDPAGYLAGNDEVAVAFTVIKGVLDKNGVVLKKVPHTFTAEVTVTDSSDADSPEVFTARLTVKLVTGLQKVEHSGEQERKLAVGKTVSLAAKYTPANVSLRQVAWSSGNRDVATVDGAGKVTAVAPGKAVISAVVTPYALAQNATGVDGGGETMTIRYTIVVPARQVAITQTAQGGDTLAQPVDVTGQTVVMVPPGYADGDVSADGPKEGWKHFEAITLNAKAVTADPANPESITWISSKPAVVEVTNGAVQVKAATPGTYTLTAKAQNGAKATMKVKVAIPPRDVSLAFADAAKDATGDVLLGKTRTLKPAFNKAAEGMRAPTNAAVEWSVVSGGEYITLSAKGAVKGVAPGAAKVRATSLEDDRVYAEYPVVVLAPVTAVRLQQQSFALPANGGSQALGAVLNGGGYASLTRPDDGTPYTEFVWTVDKDGFSFEDGLGTNTGKTSVLQSPVLKTSGAAAGEKATVQLSVTSGGKALGLVKLTVTAEDPAAYTPVTSLTIVKDKALPGEGGTDRKQLYAGGKFTPNVEFSAGASNQNVTWDVTTAYDFNTPANTDWTNTDWQRHISLNPATGEVTALLGTVNSVITMRATADAAPGVSDVFHFRIWQKATGVAIVRESGNGISGDPDEFKPHLDEPYTGTVKLKVGESLRVWGYVLPNEVTDTSAKWVRSGTAVSLTDTYTGAAPAAGGTNFPVVIKAEKAGTSTITATAADGSGKKTSFKVQVTQQVGDVVILRYGRAAAGSTYAETEITKGKAVTLTAGLNAENQVVNGKLVAKAPAPTDKKVRWVVLGEYYGHDVTDKSSPVGKAGEVLTMKNGKLTPVGDGWAEIRVLPAAETDDTVEISDVPVTKLVKKAPVTEYFHNTIRVRVNVPATKVSLLQSKFAVRPGSTVTLNAATTPALAQLSEKAAPIKWTVSKPGYVSVAQAGDQAGKDFGAETNGWRGHSITLKVEDNAPGGTVRLTAETASKKKAYVDITVKATAPLIESFALTKDATWVQRGKTEALKVSMNAGYAKKKAVAPGNGNLLWEIQEYNWGDVPDPMAPNGGSTVEAEAVGTIATIDAKGKVTARGGGFAVVTVRAVEDPDRWTDTCTVYCVPKL